MLPYGAAAPLLDADHHLLALWAADCAQHVLPFFEQAQPDDDRSRRAIDWRAWARGEIRISQSCDAHGTAPVIGEQVGL